MSKEAGKVVSAVAIGALGRSETSKAVENAMRDVVLSGMAAGEDPKAMKKKMLEARHNAKPPERR